MRVGTVWICGIAGLAGLAAGCSSDRAYAPPGTILTDAQVSADIAATAGMAAAGSIEDQGDYLSTTGVAPSLGTYGQIGNVSARPPAPSAENSAPAATTKPVCTFSAASGRWTCAPFINGRGLTVLWSYAYFDANGKATEQYSPLTTERVEYRTQSDGTIGNGNTFTGVTHRKVNQVLSGLIGKEVTRVWNGAGVSADTTNYHDSTGARHYAGVELDSVKSVIYVQPRTPGSYPLSGQIVRVANYSATASGKASETRSVSRTVVTTFNGTSAVPIRVGSVTCTLHLDTRTVDGCSRR
jgi:hypothetical protein